MVFPAAVVVGLATAEIFRRSGSIWTAVIVHVVFNLPTIRRWCLSVRADRTDRSSIFEGQY
ncbi:CPBP family intramembrane metalloprotease [Microcoleus sp. herbarium7]|uniref:CPBP family glutamic-type intramembrane protease n=1 Tax=Microcoleus sp. herbarium7 TaxID=3055435 RepID=UPI003B088D1F